MKKILTIIFLLGFIAVNSQVDPLDPVSVSKFYSEIDSSHPYYRTGWHWVKDRLFNGIDRSVPKYQGDINIQLINSKNVQDSIIITDFIKELQLVIPNKISFSTVNKGNLIIEMVFDGTLYGLERRISKSDISWQHNKIGFNVKVSNDVRKRVIEYFIVRSLCVIQNNMFSTKTRNAILDSRDVDPFSTNYNWADKFLLQKLYSSDFFQQARTFIVQRYSWRYYLNFFYKNEVRITTIALIALIVFFVFFLSYKKVFNRRFKKQYFNYLISGLILIYTTYLVILLYEYMTDDVPYSYEYQKPFNFKPLLYSLFWLIPVGILYLLEHYLIKDYYSIAKRLKLKILFTFLITIVSVLCVIIYYYDLQTVNTIVTKYLLIIIGFVFFLVRSAFLYLRGQSEMQLRKKDVELSKLKELKAQAEVASLNARINPHFLYNSLNSIAGLVRSNPEKTEQMALSLSDLFRHNINRSNALSSTIKDEIEAVQAYLQIEQIRFGDRMQFSIEVDDVLKQVEIPRNIIQPLVENAIKHGVSKTKDVGIIRVAIKKVIVGIEIIVEDNGSDFPEGVISGYGLQSIHDILKLSYNNEASLNWDNYPDKRIWIAISEKGFNNMKIFVNEDI